MLRRGRAKTFSASLPAPVGGWNALDSVAEMPPTDARFLENWLPTSSDVLLRYGYTAFATGLPGQVETLAAYAGGTTNELFAWSGTGIYDITTGGAVGAPVVTGLTNARWQFTNMANSGGNYLMAVNGADDLQLYNGTTWTAIDGVSVPAITGVTTSTLSNIFLFKKRVWFAQNGTLVAWYLGVDAISGAATAFSLQGVALKGGYIVSIAAWTIDAGYGVDDMLVFVTSRGEVIVYKGTDPSSAATWALVGVWAVGAPIGRRCFMKYSGDLLLICEDGLLPLAAALQSSRVEPRVALTNKIQGATSQAIATYGSNFGWSLLYFPRESMLFLNVPVAVGQQQQFVMNTITKAWCNFTGWAANCWELFEDSPYFGGNTIVGLAWDSLADNGTNINGAAAQAYNYFGSRGQQKRWTLARPTLMANGTPSAQSALDVDFETQAIAPISSSTVPTSAWDSAIWDTSVWGGGLSAYKSWQGINGLGFAASYRLQAASQGIEIRWVSTDFVAEKGGVL
jgi:hypothetical protein